MSKTNTNTRPKLSRLKVMHTGKMCLTIDVPGIKPLLFQVKGVRSDNRFTYSAVR